MAVGQRGWAGTTPRVGLDWLLKIEFLDSDPHSGMVTTMSKKTPIRPIQTDRWPTIFSGLAGAWLGLSLLKFGNPVILDGVIEAPKNFYDGLDQSWPVAWGYTMLVLVLVAGLKVARFGLRSPSPIVWLPIAWLAWQLVSSTRSVNPALTKATLLHFGACVVGFYVGYFALSQVRRLGLFWLGLLVGFALVLAGGFTQHYGGLDSTRQFVRENEQNHWSGLPVEELQALEKSHILIKTEDGYATHPEVIRKLEGKRISSTLVYPNTLAGVILLLLPLSLVVLGERCAGLPRMMGRVLVGLLGYMGLACLYWSGSKAGWIIALVMGAVMFFKIPFPRRLQLLLLGAFLILGLSAFFLRYEKYFQAGATSGSARVDYWRAAYQTARLHPVMGSGPGTFMTQYLKLKHPESEMTRLAHNDYLQQASDSGLIGFLLFCVLIIGSLAFLYRNSVLDGGWISNGVWLGLFGWALQSFVDFGLYIPALAWPVFVLIGWLWGMRATNNRIDRAPSAR